MSIRNVKTFVSSVVVFSLALAFLVFVDIQSAKASEGDDFQLENVTYLSSVTPFSEDKYCKSSTFNSGTSGLTSDFDNCQAMQDYYNKAYSSIKEQNLASLGKDYETLNSKLSDLNDAYSEIGIKTNNLLPTANSASQEFQTFYNLTRDFDNKVVFEASYNSYIDLSDIYARLGASDLSLARFYYDANKTLMTKYSIAGWEKGKNWWNDCEETEKNTPVPSSSKTGDICMDMWIDDALGSAFASDFYYHQDGSEMSNNNEIFEAAKQKAQQSYQFESKYIESISSSTDNLAKASQLTDALPILHRIFFENPSGEGSLSNEDYTTLVDAGIDTTMLESLMSGEQTLNTLGIDKIVAQYKSGETPVKIISSRIGICQNLDDKTPTQENNEHLALRKTCTGLASDRKFASLSFGLTTTDGAKSTSLDYDEITASQNSDNLKDVINAQQEDSVTPTRQLLSKNTGIKNIGIDSSTFNIPASLGSIDDIRFAWKTATTGSYVIEKQYSNNAHNSQYILWNDDQNHYGDNSKFFLSEDPSQNVYHKVQGRDEPIIGFQSEDAVLHNVYVWFIGANGKVLDSNGNETNRNDSAYRNSHEDSTAKDNASVNWQRKSVSSDWTQKVPVNAQKVEILNHIDGCGSYSRCSKTFELNYDSIKPYNTIAVQGAVTAGVADKTSSNVYCDKSWGDDSNKISNAKNNGWEHLLQDYSHCDRDWVGKALTEEEVQNYGTQTAFGMQIANAFGMVYGLKYGILTNDELPKVDDKVDLSTFLENTKTGDLLTNSGNVIKHLFIQFQPKQDIYKYAMAQNNAWGDDIQSSFDNATNIGITTSGADLSHALPIQNLSSGSYYSGHNADLSVSGSFRDTGVTVREANGKQWIDSPRAEQTTCGLSQSATGIQVSNTPGHLAIANGEGAFWDNDSELLSLNSAQSYTIDTRSSLNCSLTSILDPYDKSEMFQNFDKFANPTLGNVSYANKWERSDDPVYKYETTRNQINLIEQSSKMTQFGLALRAETEGSNYFSIYYRVLQKDENGKGKWSNLGKDGALVGNGVSEIYGIQSYLVAKDAKKEYVVRASGANFINGSATGTLEKTQIAYIPTDEKGNITANNWTIQTCGGNTAAASSQHSSLLNDCNIPANVNYAIVKYGFEVVGDGRDSNDFKNWTNDFFFDRNAINEDNNSAADTESQTVEIAYLSHGDARTAHQDDSDHMLTLLGIGSNSDLNQNDGIVETVKKQVKQSNISSALSILNYVLMGAGILVMPLDAIISPVMSAVIGVTMLASTLAVTVLDIYMQVKAFTPPLLTIDYNKLTKVASKVDDLNSSSTPKDKLKYPEVNGFSWGNYGLFTTHAILHYIKPDNTEDKLEFGKSGEYQTGDFIANVSPAGYDSKGLTEKLSDYNRVPEGSIIWIEAHGNTSQRFVYNPYSNFRAGYLSTGQAAASYLKFVSYDNTASSIAKIHNYINEAKEQIGSAVFSMAMDTVTLATLVLGAFSMIKNLPHAFIERENVMEEEEFFLTQIDNLFDESLDTPETFKERSQQRMIAVANVISGRDVTSRVMSNEIFHNPHLVSHYTLPGAPDSMELLLRRREFTEIDPQTGKTILKKSVVRAFAQGNDAIKGLLTPGGARHGAVQGNNFINGQKSEPKVFSSTSYTDDATTYRLELTTPDALLGMEYDNWGRISPNFTRNGEAVIVGTPVWYDCMYERIGNEYSALYVLDGSEYVPTNNPGIKQRILFEKRGNILGEFDSKVVRQNLPAHILDIRRYGTINGIAPANTVYNSVLRSDLHRMTSPVYRGGERINPNLEVGGSIIPGGTLQIGDVIQANSPANVSSSLERTQSDISHARAASPEILIEVDLRAAREAGLRLGYDGFFPDEDGAGMLPGGIKYRIVEIDRDATRDITRIKLEPTEESLRLIESTRAGQGRYLHLTNSGLDAKLELANSVIKSSSRLATILTFANKGTIPGGEEAIRSLLTWSTKETFANQNRFTDQYHSDVSDTNAVLQAVSVYTERTPRPESGLFGFNKLNGIGDNSKYQISDNLATFCQNNPQKAVFLSSDSDAEDEYIICPEQDVDLTKEPTVERICSEDGNSGKTLIFDISKGHAEISCNSFAEDNKITDIREANKFLNDSENVTILANTLQKIISPGESFTYYDENNGQVMLQRSFINAFYNYLVRFNNKIGDLPKVLADKIAELADYAYHNSVSEDAWDEIIEVPIKQWTCENAGDLSRFPDYNKKYEAGLIILDNNVCAAVDEKDKGKVLYKVPAIQLTEQKVIHHPAVHNKEMDKAEFENMIGDILKLYLTLAEKTYSKFSTGNYKSLIVKNGSKSGEDYYLGQRIRDLTMALSEEADQQIIMSQNNQFGLILDKDTSNNNEGYTVNVDDRLLSRVNKVAVSVEAAGVNPSLVASVSKRKIVYIDDKDYYLIDIPQNSITLKKIDDQKYIYQANSDDKNTQGLLSFILNGSDVMDGINSRPSALESSLGVKGVSEIISWLSNGAPDKKDLPHIKKVESFVCDDTLSEMSLEPGEFVCNVTVDGFMSTKDWTMQINYPNVLKPSVHIGPKYQDIIQEDHKSVSWDEFIPAHDEELAEPWDEIVEPAYDEGNPVQHHEAQIIHHETTTVHVGDQTVHHEGSDLEGHSAILLHVKAESSYNGKLTFAIKFDKDTEGLKEGENFKAELSANIIGLDDDNQKAFANDIQSYLFYGDQSQ